MNKFFVKNGELALVNGGYVVTGEKQTPVFNEQFIAVQKHAEWVITFAEKAKGKDFIGKQADSIADVKAEVLKALSKSDVEYVKAPKEVKRELTDKLQEEALTFIKFHGETSKTEKINKFLQQFNVVKEYEEFGLYFEENICKLNKIYTIEEIVKAVKTVIDIIE
jgi:stalled ribosome rescue protein Dom34